MGRGIEMIKDAAAYKESLMTKKDKWGEATVKPEEVKKVLEDPNAIVMDSATEEEKASQQAAASSSTPVEPVNGESDAKAITK